MDKRLKFNEPWILQRADPYVYEKDGWYYFTASVPAYDSIVLRRANVPLLMWYSIRRPRQEHWKEPCSTKITPRRRSI